MQDAATDPLAEYRRVNVQGTLPRQLLGWVPPVSVDEGLKKAAAGVKKPAAACK